MRLGIFGGSFDPVHYGHLLLAECCLEQARLDRVWLLPAGVSPHKQQETRTPGRQRAEMLELAVAGQRAFEVHRMEIDRGGISFTVDTLTAIRDRHPDAELFLLMGADSLAELPTWKAPVEICRLATPVVVCRAGFGAPDFSVLGNLVPDAQLDLLKDLQVEMPRIELASSEIRRRVRAGESIRYQTPPAVIQYIQSQGLYAEAEAGE